MMMSTYSYTGLYVLYSYYCSTYKYSENYCTVVPTNRQTERKIVYSIYVLYLYAVLEYEY